MLARVQESKSHTVNNSQHFGENELVLGKVGRQSRSHPHSIRANKGFDRAV